MAKEGRRASEQSKVLATGSLEKQTSLEYRECRTKCLCLASRLKRWMLFGRRGTHSLEKSREARLDPSVPSLKFLLQNLCMQRWQPKIIIVYRENGRKLLC